MDSNFESIKNYTKEHVGEYFKSSHGPAVLLGSVDLMDDYYYVGVTESGKVVLMTCVANPELYPRENIARNGDLIIPLYTRFLDNVEDEGKNRLVKRAWEYVDEEIRNSGINTLKQYKQKLRDAGEMLDEVIDRMKNPKKYVVYWWEKFNALSE